MELQKSFQKGFIQLKSRLVIPPMATQSSDSGIPGKETIDHYRRLAGNSLAGLLITEHSYVNPAGRATRISFPWPLMKSWPINES